MDPRMSVSGPMSEVRLRTVGTRGSHKRHFGGPLFIGAAREIKHRQHPPAMAPATDAEPRRVASGCTSDHSAEITPSHQAELKFRQAMASSYIASHYMEHQETINDSTEIDWNNGDEFLILSQRSTRALKEERARAAMAQSPKMNP